MEPRPAWQSITNLMTLVFLQFYVFFNIAIFMRLRAILTILLIPVY